MKRILIFLFIFFALSVFSGLIVKADDPATPDDEPVLPQTEPEPKKEVTQQISSPEFYSESNRDSFIKGAAAGGSVGFIVGGVIVWFFKKKLS